MEIVQYCSDQHEHPFYRKPASMKHNHLFVHMHSLSGMRIQIERNEMIPAHKKMDMYTVFNFLNILFHRINKRAKYNRVMAIGKSNR
ncbi:hypothetical protein D3C77_636230 [compost metagenome]